MTLYEQFIPLSTAKQANSVANLIRLGYTLDQLVDLARGGVLAILTNSVNLIAVHPNNYHDIRKDHAFEVVI